MRTFILTMLLATAAATPAMAQRNDNNGRWNRERSSEEARPERPSRAQAPAHQAAPQPSPQAAPQAQMNRQMQAQPQGGGERVRGGMRWGNSNGQNATGQNANAQNSNAQPTARTIDPAAMQRWQERRAQGYDRSRTPVNGGVVVAPNGAPTRWNDRNRTVDGQQRDWNRTRNGTTSTVTSDGYGQRVDGQVLDGQRVIGQRSPSGVQWRSTGDRDRDGRWDGRRNDGHRWSNDWRRDRRYDWRDYRNSNRQIYRLGRYYDPFGYGYQRLNIGFTLFSGYYQSIYWLNDPYQYRLPPVNGPYRWVRYYDDAVLVDIYTGEVVDVIQRFFW